MLKFSTVNVNCHLTSCDNMEQNLNGKPVLQTNKGLKDSVYKEGRSYNDGRIELDCGKAAAYVSKVFNRY